MYKTKLCVACVLFLVCVLFPVQGRADAILSVSAPASVSVGDTFTVEVNVFQATDLYGFQFDLGFDPTILQATGFTEGTFLSSIGSTFFFGGSIDNTAGSVAFNTDTLLGAPNGGNGNGLLMSFDFTAIAAGTSPLMISNVVLADSLGNSLNSSVANGSVDVSASENGGGGGGVPVPEPSSLAMMMGGLAFMGLVTLRKR